MRHRQQGITFLGLLILVTFVGLFVYAGIRLAPVYLDYMKVSKSLDDLAGSVSGGVTQDSIRRALHQQFYVDMVTGIGPDDIEIRREGQTYVVRAQYEVPTRFVGNVDFLVTFDKSVEVPIG